MLYMVLCYYGPSSRAKISFFLLSACNDEMHYWSIFQTQNKKIFIPNSPIIGKFERESNPTPQPPHLYLSRFAFLLYFAASDKQ